MGLRSFYVGSDHVTNRPLPGIKIPASANGVLRPSVLKDDYRPPHAAIRAALMPSSPQRLKKLTVKRRRIRNHFGGLDQLALCAITVSWLAHGASTLIGVRLRVSSRGGQKALDASESYIAEHIEPLARDQAAFCHALIVPLQLLLHEIPTVVYYDATRMRGPQDQPDGPLKDLFHALSGALPQVVFTPVQKGFHLERIHSKLGDLRADASTNEIMPGNLQALLHRQRNSLLSVDTNIPESPVPGQGTRKWHVGPACSSKGVTVSGYTRAR
jgi:hypothetical protein